MKTRTTKEYIELVELYKNTPPKLSLLLLEIGAELAYRNEQMRSLQLKKAVYRTNKKFSDGDKPLSDRAVEDMWIQTDEGKKELSLKYIIKSLSELKSVVNTHLRTLRDEQFNAY